MSDVMEFIKTQWADIHHSRNQEWTVLGMIGISLFFLSQAKDLHFQITAIGIGIATCVVGIFISIKHWAILFAKTKMINICQEKLGIKTKYFESRIRVQGMIIILYFLIISVLSALLMWLLLSKIWISVPYKIWISLGIGILIAIHSIPAYSVSCQWAKNKRDDIDVVLLPKLSRFDSLDAAPRYNIQITSRKEIYESS